MNFKVAYAMILLLVPILAFSDPVEKWICKSVNSYEWNTIVEAEVNSGRESGSIKVAGIVHEAQFEIRGFDRRWDFALQNDGTFDYTFVLQPDGSGAYYNFSRAKPDELVNPSQALKCKQQK